MVETNQLYGYTMAFIKVWMNRFMNQHDWYTPSFWPAILQNLYQRLWTINTLALTNQYCTITWFVPPKRHQMCNFSSFSSLLILGWLCTVDCKGAATAGWRGNESTPILGWGNFWRKHGGWLLVETMVDWLIHQQSAYQSTMSCHNSIRMGNSLLIDGYRLICRWWSLNGELWSMMKGCFSKGGVLAAPKWFSGAHVVGHPQLDHTWIIIGWWFVSMF